VTKVRNIPETANFLQKKHLTLSNLSLLKKYLSNLPKMAWNADVQRDYEWGGICLTPPQKPPQNRKYISPTVNVSFDYRSTSLGIA
jgi:hypothetical protein